MFFNLPAFLITLRESIEAALILGILLSYVKKIERKELRKDIWFGAGVALLISIVLALIFYFLLGNFEQYEPLIEGFAMIIASVVIAWVVLWMMRTNKNIRNELEGKISSSVKKEQRFGLFFLAFISVGREGIETILFMAGVLAVEPNVWVVLWSSLAGIAISVILALLIFLGGQKIRLKYFFLVSSILLIIFAAGIFSYGLHELQELGWFGSEGFFLQRIVWDTSGFLNDKTSELGKFLRTLVGYQDKPTWLELLSYLSYLFVIGTTLTIIAVQRRRKGKKAQSQPPSDLLLKESTTLELKGG